MHASQTSILRVANHGSLLSKDKLIFHGATGLGGPWTPHCLGFTITDTPHSVELIWTSDQPVAETSTCQHTKIHKGHPCSGRDSNPQSQIARDCRPTP